MDDKKNIYITLHKNFVHEGIEYEDRKTGETKTFNSVTLPKGGNQKTYMTYENGLFTLKTLAGEPIQELAL